MEDPDEGADCCADDWLFDWEGLFPDSLPSAADANSLQYTHATPENCNSIKVMQFLTNLCLRRARREFFDKSFRRQNISGKLKRTNLQISLQRCSITQVLETDF
jgi:hypothetical protein